MRTGTMIAALLLGGWLADPALSAEDFFPESSEVYISANDLENLDCWGLWHARNEIFARNGYKFKTAKAQAEFGTGGWTSNPDLNPYEQKNVALIQEYEKASSCD